MRASFAIGLMAAIANAQVHIKMDDFVDFLRTGKIDNTETVSGTLSKTEEVVELVDGFLMGVFETENVEGLETCIEDINPLVTYMDTAVADFKDPSYHKIADGIYNLGLWVSQVGILMESCAAVSDEDSAKLTEMGQAILHPMHLVIDTYHNVYINGEEIYHSLHKAGNEMDKGEYYKAGEDYGKFAALVLWGQANETYTTYAFSQQ